MNLKEYTFSLHSPWQRGLKNALQRLRARSATITIYWDQQWSRTRDAITCTYAPQLHPRGWFRAFLKIFSSQAKLDADEQFKIGNFQESIRLYTIAIEQNAANGSMAKHVLLSNRSASYASLKQVRHRYISPRSFVCVCLVCCAHNIVCMDAHIYVLCLHTLNSVVLIISVTWSSSFGSFRSLISDILLASPLPSVLLVTDPW